MPEDLFETEQPKQFDLARILNLVRRRHMQFLLPFFLGWIIVWTASWMMPERYKSTTTILVQQPSTPQNYVTPNVSVDMQTRLASLTEQILSRTRLLTIANRLHLYDNPDHSIPPDELVRHMRQDIKIALLRPGETGPISGFTVSYSSSSPLIAQRVTSELTNLFIQNNQASLQQESESTTKFLQEQLAKARISLSDQEARVSQFQSAHQGSLPAQQASNLQILSGLQSQLRNDEDSLTTARQQKVYLQSLLRQYDALHSSSALTGDTPSDLASLTTQLATMKAQLADLKTRYTERYPAVQALQEKIDATTKERNRLVAAYRAGPKAQQGKQSSAGTSSPPPIPDGNPTVLQLHSQLEATNSEIANRQHDIAGLKRRIDSYQARLNTEPEVAAQLSSLTSAYQISQTHYNELLKKARDSAMATSMEQMQKGERFSVLDPPSLPIAPYSPNRVKLSLLGIACGLALGLAVAGGMEFLDDRLYTDKEIEDLLPVAVIGEIPEIVTETELKRTKRRLALGWLVAVVVILLVSAGSAFSYLYGSSPSIHLNNVRSSHHV